MRIGELADLTGVPTKTIRYYEEIEVLASPERATNGYRDYGAAAVERLRFIRDARATGLSLREIGSILSLRDEGESTCEHVLGLLQKHVADIDAHIASLHKTRQQLESLTRRAINLDPSDCTDPNRCQTIMAAGNAEVVHAHHVQQRPGRL